MPMAKGAYTNDDFLLNPNGGGDTAPTGSSPLVYQNVNMLDYIAALPKIDNYQSSNGAAFDTRYANWVYGSDLFVQYNRNTKIFRIYETVNWTTIYTVDLTSYAPVTFATIPYFQGAFVFVDAAFKIYLVTKAGGVQLVYTEATYAVTGLTYDGTYIWYTQKSASGTTVTFKKVKVSDSSMTTVSTTLACLGSTNNVQPIYTPKYNMVCVIRQTASSTLQTYAFDRFDAATNTLLESLTGVQTGAGRIFYSHNLEVATVVGDSSNTVYDKVVYGALSLTRAAGQGNGWPSDQTKYISVDSLVIANGSYYYDGLTTMKLFDGEIVSSKLAAPYNGKCLWFDSLSPLPTFAYAGVPTDMAVQLNGIYNNASAVYKSRVDTETAATAGQATTCGTGHVFRLNGTSIFYYTKEQLLNFAHTKDAAAIKTFTMAASTTNKIFELYNAAVVWTGTSDATHWYYLKDNNDPVLLNAAIPAYATQKIQWLGSANGYVWMAYHTTTTSPVYVKLRRIKLSDLSFTDYTITDYDCVTGGIYLSYNNTSYWNAGASATGGANIIAMSHDCKSIMMFALAAPGGSNIWVYPDIANSFTKRGIAQLGSSNYFAPNSDSGFAILCTSTSNNVSTSYWASPVTGTGIIYDVATDTVTGSMKGDAYIQVILGMYDKTPLAQCKTTSAGTVTGVYDVRNGSLLMSTATNYAGSTLETFITDKTIMLLVVTSTGTWYFKFGFSVLKQGG